jgi:predicted small lipoprotein YifL
MLGFAAMRRQFSMHAAVRAAAIAALFAVLAGCGVKGPLRPAPKSTPEAKAPTVNPATPPATTSPALPPPSIPAAR